MENISRIMIDGPNQLLYQWDKGQRLRLPDADAGVRVDFARFDQDRATSVKTYEENGVTFCDIPDVLLTEAGYIHGYVYVTDGQRGETVREFLFPVVRKQKPEDYVEPEEILYWHSLEQRLILAERKIEDLKDGGGIAVSVRADGDALVISTSMGITTCGDAIIIGGV